MSIRVFSVLLIILAEEEEEVLLDDEEQWDFGFLEMGCSEAVFKRFDALFASSAESLASKFWSLLSFTLDNVKCFDSGLCLGKVMFDCGSWKSLDILRFEGLLDSGREQGFEFPEGIWDAMFGKVGKMIGR